VVEEVRDEDETDSESDESWIAGNRGRSSEAEPCLRIPAFLREMPGYLLEFG
jgi:hypothetical protein